MMARLEGQNTPDLIFQSCVPNGKRVLARSRFLGPCLTSYFASPCGMTGRMILEGYCAL